MAYFEVCAKCGHVGNGRYINKVFAVCASNAREAARAARFFPRVKHHKKDAITYVHEIDEARYLEIWEINEHDPYFKCHSNQDQRLIASEIEDEIVDDRVYHDDDEDEDDSPRVYYSGKTKVKKPHKYHKYYETRIESVWVA
ncbi:MAG: hypothetical protein MJ166_07705 [Clostridia bacterium]|nr:hypothetical protein [Clostridia bacterium]